MIRTYYRTAFISDVMQFFCPTCGSEDVAYLEMPSCCYFCGTHHEDDFSLLGMLLEERIRYFSSNYQENLT